MVFFSNWNKNITKKITIKSWIQTKIWYILSFRNSRRNIVCLYVHQNRLTKGEFSHMAYSCILLAVPSLRSKWKQILDFIYIYQTFLGVLYILCYIRSHLCHIWNMIYKFIYTSLTYKNKNTLLLRSSRKI